MISSHGDHSKVREPYLDRSRMFSWRGGSLGSDPGGELAGEPPEEPQDEEPELEEDIELVLCRDGIPCTSLLFTTFAKQEINSALRLSSSSSSAYLQAVDESRQTNSERRLAVLVAFLPPSLLLLAVTVLASRS